jgi:hypothetical protein
MKLGIGKQNTYLTVIKHHESLAKYCETAVASEYNPGL